MNSVVQVTMRPSSKRTIELWFQATPEGWVELGPPTSDPPMVWIQRSPENWVWFGKLRDVVDENFGMLWSSTGRHVRARPWVDTYILTCEIPEVRVFNATLFMHHFPVDYFVRAPGNIRIQISHPLPTGREMS